MPKVAADEGEDAWRRLLAERIRTLVATHGGVAEISRLSGVPQRSLANYTSGDAEPKGSVLARLADTMNITVDFMLGREVARMPATSGMAPDGFIAVPRVDVSASAGPGIVPSNDVASNGVMYFPEIFLRSLGMSPAYAELLESSGDSMFPTIHDGDWLLVNTSPDQGIVNGKIYVLMIGGMVAVKRLQVLRDHSVVLISDNPIYDKETIPADETFNLRIRGQVSWFARKMR